MTCKFTRHPRAHAHEPSNTTDSNTPNPNNGWLKKSAPITSIATAPPTHALDIWLIMITSDGAADWAGSDTAAVASADVCVDMATLPLDRILYRHRHTLHDLGDYGGVVPSAQARARAKHNAVGQGGHGHALHIVGQDEVTSLHSGQRLRRAQQGQRRTR